MMRASKLIQGEISSHRRPLRWVYPFDDGGEHGPLFPLQVSTPLHWDFTNLLVWPSPLTPPWGERNVTLPVAMRRSHTFCAHRYSMLFPFRGSSWVLRRYHPQITVGFSPAVPLTEGRDSIASCLFTSTHWELWWGSANFSSMSLSPFPRPLGPIMQWPQSGSRHISLMGNTHAWTASQTLEGKAGYSLLGARLAPLPSSKPASAFHL